MPNTARRMSIYYNQPEKYFLGWLVRVRGEDQAGPLRCRGLFRGIASPAVLCHKEPVRLVLYGIRAPLIEPFRA